MATSKAKKGRSISVDLSDAEGSQTLPEGPATLTISKITEEEGKDSGQPFLKFEFNGESEDGTKGKVWDNISLQPQALFKLRGLLEALGYDIPDKAMDIDLDELEGLSCGADLEHEEYKGKAKAKVAAYYDQFDEPADPEPEVKKGTKTPVKAPVEDEPEVKKMTKKSAAVTVPEIGDKVSFEDDAKEEQIGKVIDVDEEKQEAAVKVGREVWSVDFKDLTVL